MRNFLLALALLAPALPDLPESILYLTGASCIEELDESEIERWRSLSEHPLDLNAASRSRLASSGLFSGYQVAVLMDERSRGGDILSLTELGLLDGFSPEFAQALRHFIVLRTSAPPGGRQKTALHGDAMVRGAARQVGEDGEANAGAKIALQYGEHASLNWASRTTYSDSEFGPGTASVAYYGKRFLGKVVAGDYNARFGQGLAMWSGFTMSGVPSAASLRRSGTGLSPSSSFTRTLHGVGADFNFGGWTLSAAYSWPDVGMVNLEWTGRRATLGVTWADGTAAAHWQVGGPGLAFFGEAALPTGTPWGVSSQDSAASQDTSTGSSASAISPAALAGVLWVPEYGTKISALLRYYSPGYAASHASAVRSSTKTTDELGASAGVQSAWFQATVDAVLHPSSRESQVKALVTAAPSFEAGPLKIAPAARLSVRYRDADASPLRTDLRAELKAALGSWSLEGRYNALWCKDFAWLWFAEAGYSSTLRACLRFTLFKIDDWEDRIYVYEHDAPGNFTVPAYYGRGWALSAFAGWKFARHERRLGHALYLRASLLRYPWTEPAKDSKTEIKLQWQVSL